MYGLAYPVRHALMGEFRDLATQEGCKVKNVVEQIGRQLIVYYLDVPEGKEALISDMAFMTFIKNPKFQKYYTLNESVLERIKSDDDAFDFSREQIRKRQEEEKTARVEFIKEIFWQQFDFKIKKPVGLVYIKPGNIGVYDRESDSYIFKETEGTENRGEWSEERKAWLYPVKMITPVVPKFFFREGNIWHDEQVQFRFVNSTRHH